MILRRYAPQDDSDRGVLAMGGRVGGVTSKYYYETAGLKVSGGQRVKSGTILTRRGDQWKRGLHVIGRSSLTAACDGEVYFTRRKNGSNKVITLININPRDSSPAGSE